MCLFHFLFDIFLCVQAFILALVTNLKISGTNNKAHKRKGF